jgi:hypothetical protein
MNMQRKLNALLFELQSAQSPLAQAKTLARSWRTVRDLSPTDRRLLARHVSFDGAEQILEGLASKKRGFAPAVLLQMLNNAKATDGAAVASLLSAVRDPSRRVEAVTIGADLAADLLRDPEEDIEPEEISTALGELRSVDPGPAESPEDEALAALAALDEGLPGSDVLDGEASAEIEPPAEAVALEDEPHDDAVPPPPPPPKVRLEKPKAPVPPPAPPKPSARIAPSEGWNRLAVSSESERRGPVPQQPSVQNRASDSPKFESGAVFAALGAEASSFSRLLVLHREIESFRGSNAETLHEMLLEFPDGWVRRRALSALISAGILERGGQALELIATLEREMDRRWCLAALARRGDLRGTALKQSLDLLTSPSAKEALQRIASSA